MPQYYMTNGDSTEPTTQEELDTALLPIRAWLKTLTATFDPPDDANNTVDWTIIWAQLLPDSDDFINTQLQARYRVPLRKTVNLDDDGIPTEYQRRIREIAALYVAWRIESRTYPGAYNPGKSEYAGVLETQLNTFINELTTDKIRLRGQRLKGAYRTVNPRFAPTVIDEETRSSDNASSGVGEFNRG